MNLFASTIKRRRASNISLIYCRNHGFSLLELLTVIAILSLLVGIAVPALLGHREKTKAKALIASAKSSTAEIQGVLNSFIDSNPIILFNSDGNEICTEKENADTSKTC